jgi:hypothetical protein
VTRILFLLAIVAAPVLGQEPNQPAHISGRVVAAETGTPLRGVLVELTGGAAPAPFVVTDVDGRFEFLERRVGRYAMQATKAGYVPYLFGRLSDRGEMFDVLAGQRIDRGTMRLSRAAVISGQVADDAGEPILEATVAAWRIEFPQPGMRWLQLIREVRTDDRGEYRLHGLMPGQYQIAASRNPPPTDARSFTLELEARLAAERAGVVFPGPGLSTFSDVITAEAAAGGETAGMNFTVARPRYVRVSGTILDTTGRPAIAGTVGLRPMHIGAGTSGRYYSQVGSKAGRFSFTNVPIGEYRLSATFPRTEILKDQRVVTVTESVTMSVSVREEIPGLIVQATPPNMLFVSGRVFIDGAPADAPLRLRLFDVPAGAPPVAASIPDSGPPGQTINVDKTGNFRTVAGAGFFVLLRPSDFRNLKSVTADGVDVTDGFELTRAMTVDVHLTSQVSVLEGLVKPSDGVIAGDCDVVVFAAESSHWRTPMSRRVVTVRCDDKGKFRITGLPTGQYLAAVPADFDRRMWADPDRLERLRAFATPFTVTEGATTEVRIEVRR